MPSLSHRTPRESPTLATVNSLSDSRATRHVVPERWRKGDREHVQEVDEIRIRYYILDVYRNFNIENNKTITYVLGQ